MSPFGVVLAGAVAAALSFASSAVAQTRMACGEGLVQRPVSPIHRAASEADRIPIRFIGHATFLIRSPQGVNVITDYNDYYRAEVLPDIATMNSNRGNHRTYHIEPQVAHALYGFDRGDGIPRHDITFKDVRVYSEPTNIFPYGQRYTNQTAIFVIQVGGLCIAHFGHTGHMLDDETARKLGQIDIVLTPVDRTVTQSYEELFHNIRALRARVVGVRKLLHDHTDEQPFTRDLQGVREPGDSPRSVQIRGHHDVRGYDGATLKLDLPARTGN